FHISERLYTLKWCFCKKTPRSFNCTLNQMLAIFDIDGTICDTQDIEGICYAQAYSGVFNQSLETVDWSKFEDPTSAGIIRSLCGNMSDFGIRETRFKERFVQLLKEKQPHHPGDFSPLPGAVDFMKQLSDDYGYRIAFATGGFDTEAEFKLACCGIELSAYAHATSSDTPKRTDIIRLATQRAQSELTEVVYFGDAPWDVVAC
ncbi:MAG: HAD family hydrolase, partial [Opitutales bacterium]|nr:HAD family hydrolase [Opitutales bacterium]